MATRGFEHFTEADAMRLSRRTTTAVVPVKPSKYRNQRCEVAGITFDSKREAEYWMLLKAREMSGEITELRRQVRFPLHCPSPGPDMEVCNYVADFVYRDAHDTRRVHVVDAKGMRTQLYKLKAKWLALEHGITVEEV